MDFVTHLPRTQQRHDAVWVIVDRLTKSAHFLVMRITFTLERLYRLYIREIVRLHGVPVSIVSDRDPRFTAHFWKSFQKAMGTRVAPLSRPDLLGRIRIESGMPLKSLHHSKSYLCGSDYKIGQAHKHLHLTKSIYNEGIQTFSK